MPFEFMATEELDVMAHEESIRLGAYPSPLNYHGYPKAICTSINEVICHGIPNERILADGDIINVDVTCNLNGYFGDASRMFIIGEIPDSTRELVEETKKCLELGIAQVRPGELCPCTK